MSSFILLPLCLISWIFTGIRLRALLREGIQDVEMVALNIWLMVLFFSFTLTFMLTEFATFFNAHTFPNFSLLISHSAAIFTTYFGTTTSLQTVEATISKRILQWIRVLLVIVLIMLVSIYIPLVSKLPSSLFFTPQSISEVIFKLITCSFGITMAIIAGLTHWVYLPSEKFALMRFRGIIIILCALGTASYLLVRATIFISYFWPFLMSPVLVTLSYVLLISLTLLCFFAISSNRIYARFVIMSKNMENWQTFQDLRCLAERLLLLCPPIGMLPNYPNFFKFFFNPEYHLYRALIVILDSKVMLDEFLAESLEPGNPGIWEGEQLEEAIRINTALQSANPSNDFSDIVAAYRRVSRDLFTSQI